MRLSGPWRRDYSEFFDTQEALLIDAMDNADSIYMTFFRLQAVAVKCGCTGRLVFRNRVPYTDEMLAAVTKKTVPAFRQSMQTLLQLGLVTSEGGVYAIADWELNQNARAIDMVQEGDRERKAASRARRNGGKTASDRKRESLAAFLAKNPEATKAEMHKATGLSRVTIDKYLSEPLPLLPATASRIGEDAVQNVQNVQSDVQNVQISGVQMDVQLYTGMYAEMYTTQSDETAGSAAKKDENDGVQNPSRPKNIDDRYKKSSTSTAGRPHDLSEVEAFFAERGLTVDARRFWEVNEARGWVTATGRPVDDWRRLALTWQAHEHAPAARAEAGTPAAAPTVESVMERFKVSREEALELMGSGLT